MAKVKPIIPTAEARAEDTFLRPADLAERWRVSPELLNKWRYELKGPPYLKLSGGIVVYRLRDILACEEGATQGWTRQSIAQLIRDTPGVDVWTADAIIEHVLAATKV